MSDTTDGDRSNEDCKLKIHTTMHVPNINHFNNIPLKERVVSKSRESYLKGCVPAKVYEMVYDNGSYLTVIGLWPNGEKVQGFKVIWSLLVERYGGRLLPLYYVVENGTKSNYIVVHFRKTEEDLEVSDVK